MTKNTTSIPLPFYVSRASGEVRKILAKTTYVLCETEGSVSMVCINRGMDAAVNVIGFSKFQDKQKELETQFNRMWKKLSDHVVSKN